MMDYDKIYERIVRRGDDILENRRKKAVKIKQTSYAVSGLCAAAIVGVSVWRLSSSNDLTENKFPESNIVNDIESTTTITSSISGTTATTTNMPITSVSASTTSDKTEITKTTNKIATNVIVTESTHTLAVAAETTHTSISTVAQTTQPQITTLPITTEASIATTLIPDRLSLIDIFLEINIDVGIDPDTGEKKYRSYWYSPVSIDNELLDAMLYEKHVETEYYDSSEKVLKTAETDVKIYSIKQTSSKAIVAVKFKDDNKYYVYYDKSYSPDSLQSMISDLVLSSDGLENTAYIAIVNKKSQGFDAEKIWNMLTENTDLTNDYRYCNDHGIVVVPKVSFYYISPYISAICGSIGISENGYISSNIGRNGSYYFIGEEKAKEIIDYVTTSSIN